MNNGNSNSGKQNISDAAAAVRDRWLSTLPNADIAAGSGKCVDECRNLFSSSIYPQMKRRRRKTQIRKGLVAVLIAFVMISATGFMFNDNVRAVVRSWSKKFEFGGPQFEFRGEAPSQELPEYVFGWLPGKYSVTEEEIYTGKEFVLTNIDDSNDFMRFGYSWMDENTVIGLLGEDLKYDVCSVNGSYAEFYYKTDEEGDQNLLLWVDEDERIFFTLNSNIDKEVMIYMAESIKEVRN